MKLWWEKFEMAGRYSVGNTAPMDKQPPTELTRLYHLYLICYYEADILEMGKSRRLDMFIKVLVIGHFNGFDQPVSSNL